MSEPKSRSKRAVWLNNATSLSVQEIVDRGVEAEGAGWDGVFLSDELVSGSPDPWTILAAIAARTESVRLGTWITPIPTRLPWRTAQSLATLDQISNGRVIVGAGLGIPGEYTTYGGAYDAKAIGHRYDEALEIIAGLWTEKPFSYDGTFFTVNGATLGVTPVQQPRIPILIAAWWPNKKPIRRAALWDGIMPYWASLMGDATGPQGERATGTVTEELRSIIDYYHSCTDDPGEIFLPDIDDDAYRAICQELGATWLLDSSVKSMEAIQSGPK